MKSTANNNLDHSKLETSSPTCLAPLLQQWSWHCKMFLVFLERLFEKCASFISKRPFFVIFLAIFLAIVFTSGFIQLNVEKEVKYLFLPENSQASLDINKVKSFGFDLEVRQEEVIILPKENETVLSQECLAEMIDVHERIVQIEGYEKYCYRPKSIGKCVSTNLLELFEYSKTRLYNISGRIEAVFRNDSFIMSNGRRLKDNFNLIFGKSASNSSLYATNALRMVYVMTEQSNQKERDKILNWESKFIEIMSEFSKNTTCANIVYSAERSLDDSVSESTGSDIRFFAVTFTIMGVFSSIVNGRCADPLYGHQLLGFCALLAIYLGVTSAFGLLMYIGIPFVNMVGVLPFLVVSIGIDDVFIILHELNEIIRDNIPAVHILSGSMARSGPTITMTTLTDLVAFAVSCRSVFPAVRFFCTYAALAITFAFLMLVTFFVACIWFDMKRINSKRQDFLPCFITGPSSETSCCTGIRRNALDNVMKGWGRILTTTSGKTVVFLLSMVLLAGGIYGALHVDESFSRQLLTSEDSYYRTFLDVYERHFHLDIEVNLVIPGNVDYSSSEIQQRYLDLQSIATSNDYFTPKTISWLSEFLTWAKVNNFQLNSTESFYEELQYFLSLPHYRTFAQDVKFTENRTHITASRILVFSKSNPRSNFQKNMMISLREDLSRYSNLDAVAVALPFIYFEQYVHVSDETIRNLIIAGISILVISSLFLIHPMIILCLLCGFITIIVELLGLMYVWDVSINSISMINLVMALGFSVDYNAHVAYHFVTSKARSPELRIVDALSTIGGSVLLGGLSTFLGMMPTGFASSIVFRIFFKMFIGIVVLGLLHGLVILPVYLSLLGKVFNLEISPIEQLMKIWNKSIKRGSTSSDEKNKEKVQKPSLTRKFAPIAVVGISCRFPSGANSKDEFWNMLVEGKCGISSYPKDRPDAREMLGPYNPGRGTPGKHYVLTGAYLDKVSGFDAQFFGISSAESRSMDPQQRLLLHVVYEAIEDAGLRLEDLQQCRTGVYVGLMNLDYGGLLLDESNIRKIDQFASTGCTSSVAANRISFSLNLTGPSLTVDTACSSSLTALHLAFVHMQTGECDVAIVCAPNILLSGRKFHTACCKTGLLAEDGRCKSFDLSGDGYGRGEGIAAVVLKPTIIAFQDRDDTYAEIVACGLNNDGQTAIPMTSPSEETQAHLARRVLLESGLSKDDIQYVEAHGTGTAIGDVVEMGSIASVYGNSSTRVLRVGSVKSNINHTESTAGLAGLIKTCLMIKYEYFVPTINVHNIKPQLKMSERKMMVQVQYEPWKSESGKPRTAAVCSYGYGGSNAHVILQEVSQTPVPLIPNRSYVNRIMTLSARSNEALKAMAQKFSQSLEMKPDDDELLKDNICYSLNERYTVHSQRLAVSFRSLKQAARALSMFAEQEKGWQEFVTVGDATVPLNKVVFLYGGQGSQWYGMAKEMMMYEPTFKESIERIDKILRRQGISWSLTEEFSRSEETSRMNENPIGQTALFAVHFALTNLLKSWGVTPSAVVGHSLGEISAACASGALSLTEALHLVLIRSQLHENCSPAGRMAAIGMSPQDASNMLHSVQLENHIDIAVINSPTDVVLSGDKESMQLIERHVHDQFSSVFWRTLGTTRPFHSRQMEEISQAFMDETRKIKLRPCQGSVPFYSTVTGTQISGKQLSRDHWWRNIRETVLLSSALQSMFNDGYRAFIEINAGPQHSRHVHQIWSQFKKARTENVNDVVVIKTLPKRSAKEQHKSFLQNCVASLFTRGVPLSWNRIQGSGSRSFIRRPTYPWQENEFWYRDDHPVEFVTSLNEKVEEGERAMLLTGSHPLLGKRVSTKAFSGLHAWECEVDLFSLPYLKDHKFEESPDPIMPAAVYVEMVFALVLHMFPRAVPNVHNVMFNNLLTISSNECHKFRTRLHTCQTSTEGSYYQITKVEDDENEVVVSEGSVQLDVTEENQDEPTKVDLDNFEAIKARMVQRPPEYLIEEREKMGFCFGPQFSLITQTWSSDNEALATIHPTDEILNTLSDYVIHPCIIDACFQSLLLVLQIQGKFLPYQISNMTILRKDLSRPLFSHVRTIHSGKEKRFNITLMDCYGRGVMLLNGFLGINLSTLKPRANFKDVAFKMAWNEEYLTIDPPQESAERKTWLILRDRRGFAQMFFEHLPRNETATFVNMQDTAEELRALISQSLNKTLSKRNTQEKNDKLVVINFWPVDASLLKADSQNFMPSHFLTFESSLILVQEILKKEDLAKEIQLVFVTSGIVSITGRPNVDYCATEESEPVFPWSSSIFGFRRTLSEEVDAPKASVIDLPENPSANDFQQMIADIGQVVINEEIAYRNGLRYVNQLARLEASKMKLTKEEPPVNKSGDPKAFKVSFISNKIFLREMNGLNRGGESPVLEVFFARPVLKRYWTSLNMSDNVTVVGKLRNKSDNYDGEDLMVGVCEARNLGSYVAAEECSCLTKVNHKITAQQAASLAFPMAISYHLIKDILIAVEGKKILVYHEEEEICCIFAFIAISLGASVVGLTKDWRGKDQLKRYGIPMVLTEEELLIGDELNDTILDVICFLKNPRGIILQQVMKHLKPGGQVIAVSEKKSTKLNVSNEKDFSFMKTSLADVIKDSKRFSSLLDACMSVLASTEFLQKLLKMPQVSTSIFDVIRSDNASMTTRFESERQTEPCLRTVSFKPKYAPEKVEFLRVALDSNGLSRDRTYLVIGGIRGFGFKVARWMVENGAKTVMCTARSPPSDEKKSEAQHLEMETGCRILFRQADVTSWKDMTVVKQELEGLPDVAGIVFSAMVLDDQMIKDADFETCERVVSTKVLGSVLLHQLSLSMDLDFFIMFSSISGVLGNVGQVSYAAANTFLDSLCEYRLYRLGLPALSVNWGPISDAGVLERNKDVAALLEKLGLNSISHKTGMEFLKRFLLQSPNEAQVCLSNVNWPVYLRNHVSPRLQLIRDEISSFSKLQSMTTLQELWRQPLELRMNYVKEFVRNLLSTWSGADPAEVDLNVGLYKYGIDSIGAASMGIQIENGIGASFETHYFIQPKTTGLTIIKDILDQIENSKEPYEEKSTDNERTSFPLEHGVTSFTRDEQDLQSEELQANQIKEKIVPLYVPDEADVKVFMVHSSHKSALANAPFALGFQQQTLVALYSIGLDESTYQTSDYGTVQVLGKRYLKLIQKEQSRGPYYIAGFSFGGMLAYEMASQLVEQDEEVAMVWMLDTYPWFPKLLSHAKQFSLSGSHLFLQHGDDVLTKRLLKQLAYVRLGLTSKQFDELREQCSTEEQFISTLDERAVDQDVPLHVREEISSLQYQLKAAMTAHNSWQPPKIRYEETLTFVRCEETKIIPLFWDAPQTWKSLTEKMDLLSVPGNHFGQQDEISGKICGSLIMTTAAMKYRTKYSMLNLSGLRARGKERQVDWLKQGVDISMYSNAGCSAWSKGTLWLDEKESSFIFSSEGCGFSKKQKIMLRDLHNVLPGKYVNSIQKNRLNQNDVDLIISILTNRSKLYNFRCSDWHQRDRLMDSFDALFAIRLVRINN